ncbi:hypothetical protein ACS0TY_034707 [Phlomoides rotata]
MKVLLDGVRGAYTPTLQQYQAKADYFTCACLQKNNGYNIPMTPGGLLYLHEWNNLQYTASAAFLLVVYSDYLAKAKGFADPNVIYGALVGGPNVNDEFIDDRSNYKQTEPTLSGAAPLVRLFSKLHSLPGNSSGSYNQESPKPYVPYHKPQDNPVELLHSITNPWTVGKESFCRHKVIIKNVFEKLITELKLQFDNLIGTLWGLSLRQEKNT